jgi:carbon storage regulator
MLVLSRRPEEKILLPTVPAVIKVIAAQSGLVRVGIEAPAHVLIFREELCREGGGGRPAEPPEGAPAGARHALRNRVNNLILGLALLRMQLGEECGAAVRKNLAGMEEELAALRQCVMGDVPEDLPVPSPLAQGSA